MALARTSRLVGRVSSREDRHFLGGAVAAVFGKSQATSEQVYLAMISRGYAGEARTLSTWRLRRLDFVWSAVVAVGLAPWSGSSSPRGRADGLAGERDAGRPGSVGRDDATRTKRPGRAVSSCRRGLRVRSRGRGARRGRSCDRPRRAPRHPGRQRLGQVHPAQGPRRSAQPTQGTVEAFGERIDDGALKDEATCPALSAARRHGLSERRRPALQPHRARRGRLWAAAPRPAARRDRGARRRHPGHARPHGARRSARPTT